MTLPGSDIAGLLGAWHAHTVVALNIHANALAR